MLFPQDSYQFPFFEFGNYTKSISFLTIWIYSPTSMFWVISTPNRAVQFGQFESYPQELVESVGIAIAFHVYLMQFYRIYVS